MSRSSEQATEIADPNALTLADGTHRLALAVLYQRYSGWLRMLLRRRYGEIAEDLVQETYIRIAPYQMRGEIRHPQALLLRIAGNLARNHHRREASGRRLWGAAADEDQSRNLATAADQIEALLFKQVVLGLPKIYRDVMILSRFTGLMNRQIADELGLSVKTVEWRLAKAVQLCLRQLGDTD